jgi:hypothetical protein
MQTQEFKGQSPRAARLPDAEQPEKAARAAPPEGRKPPGQSSADRTRSSPDAGATPPQYGAGF